MFDMKIVCTGHVKMFVIYFFLDNYFIKFRNDIYNQVTGILMGANYAPLVADLFIFCYGCEVMKNLSVSNALHLIDEMICLYVLGQNC